MVPWDRAPSLLFLALYSFPRTLWGFVVAVDGIPSLYLQFRHSLSIPDSHLSSVVEHFYLTFHMSDLTYPKWKNSLCFFLVLSITVCQVIQARNLGVILHSSLHSISYFLSVSNPVCSFSAVHGFFHFSLHCHRPLPDS